MCPSSVIEEGFFIQQLWVQNAQHFEPLVAVTPCRIAWGKTIWQDNPALGAPSILNPKLL